MTKIADANEVATHFDQWLKEVAAGHEVIVTQNDQPVAKFVGTQKTDASTLPETAEGIWPTISSKWIGEANLKRSDLAEELFDRS